MSDYLNSKHGSDLKKKAESLAKKYKLAEPFPNISIEDFFDENFLNQVLDEFPDLSEKKSIKYDNPKEIKLAGKGETFFGPKTKEFMRFLNSEEFLEFLQIITGINEPLISDPYFAGGGQHEIKKGGLLKIHADFNKHPFLGLDRRINVLIYLNKNWKEEYGGGFELWDKNMEGCVQKILPKFNTLAMFSTTSQSYHGLPDPLTCPDGMSRKSLALYYYSNGRPKDETTSSKKHSTLFQDRKGLDDLDNNKSNFKESLIKVSKQVLPPILVSTIKKISK